jgi:hypothetical protein
VHIQIGAATSDQVWAEVTVRHGSAVEAFVIP